MGLTDQTDLFFTIAEALKLPQTPAELSRNARVQVAPRTVTRGATVAVNGWSFYGDDTVNVELRSGSTTRTLGTQKVSGGSFGSSLTAPSTAGSWTVTVTGADSGKTVGRELVVR